MVIIGSARKDENSKYTGGKAGDQLQKDMSDYSGEVSMQNFYEHPKKWVVLRPLSKDHKEKIADSMIRACCNLMIGYDQGNRLDIIKHGTKADTPTECDCSSLVRQCVKEATGKDPGNFTTANEKKALLATGFFVNMGVYSSVMKLEKGDVLVTETKGHTAIVCYADMQYFPMPIKKETKSFVDLLKEIGANYSFEYRTKIALANGFTSYRGTAEQNTVLRNKLLMGTLIKP